MDNTAGQITHQIPVRNFQIDNSKIATQSTLERITFVQWHIFDTMQNLTENINVIRLACLLASFSRMGIAFYRISQNEIAEKMAMLFDMEVPSRNTVSKWEHELEKLGLLEIPRHVDWRMSQTKVRKLTEKFHNMARRGLKKISHTYPPVTYCAGKVERVKQVLPDPNNNNNSVTEIRAREQIADSQRKSRADVSQKKYSRPPKSKSHKLNKFENSVMWWFFQHNYSGVSYRDKILLFSSFLSLGPRDEYYLQLQRAWAQCHDASRHGLIRDLIRTLQRDRNDETEQPVAVPLRMCPDVAPSTENANRLRQSLFFGDDYEGPDADIVFNYQEGDENVKNGIVERLMREGKI